MSSILNNEGRSKGEIEALEVAEEAREQEWAQPSFVADLFMGNLRKTPIVQFPEQPPEDKKIGDEYLVKLEDFLSKNLDADQIDLTGEIPKEVLDGLAKLGAFGLKIPKKYGGLGFSQSNYLRALGLVFRYCGSTAATLSAHQSIGVPQPLIHFGTEEQKQKYLPRLAKGEISAFALTEPEVGSDPAQMSTHAELTEDGQHYIINGTKLWCTNGAFADLIVVMAQTKPKMVNGREKKQISAFIVETNTPGFEVLHRCRFMGLNGVQNALLKFENVKIPKENLLWEEGKGLRLALVTLNQGRLSLPAACVGGTKDMLRAARKWAGERVQWGAPIGKHEASARKLARASSTLFAMESITLLSGEWVDRKTQDIRLEAAMAKLFCTIQSHEVAEEILQLRGGRGYERASSLKARGEDPFPIERMVRDSRINQIIEGTNEILSLFIAREALDKHLRIAGPLLDPKASLGTKLTTLVKAGLFYLFWLPRQWIHFSCWPKHAEMGKLGSCMRYAERSSHRLARTTFLLMLKFGPKLEKKQLQLVRLVQIATDLFAMTASIGRAQKLKKDPSRYPQAEEIAAGFCRDARRRINQNFRAICCNDDKKQYQLSQMVLKGEQTWQEENF